MIKCSDKKTKQIELTILLAYVKEIEMKLDYMEKGLGS